MATGAQLIDQLDRIDTAAPDDLTAVRRARVAIGVPEGVAA